jgi:hypothetical protein
MSDVYITDWKPLPLLFSGMTGSQTDRKCGRKPPIDFLRTTWKKVPVTRE